MKKLFSCSIAFISVLCASLFFSCTSDGGSPSGELYGTSGKFSDDRDDNSYKWVKIGEQYWMAENLNYDVPGNNTDVCYNNDSVHCANYGRLYDWATAMNLPASCNSSSCSSLVNANHKGICPSGWHIPSDADWNVLMKSVNPSCSDNSSCAGAGTKLKAKNGWNNSGNGTDDYGFAALPGGNGYSTGNFNNAGYNGYWWSTTENNANNAYNRDMDFSNEAAYRSYNNKNNYLFSVRCLHD